MSVGPWQIAILALVVLLLVGASRLGDIGKGLGEAIRNFKKGISETPDEQKPQRKSTKAASKRLKTSDGAEAARAAATHEAT
jgi:sec-independent protein translocase protein TatA